MAARHRFRKQLFTVRDLGQDREAELDTASRLYGLPCICNGLLRIQEGGGRGHIRGAADIGVYDKVKTFSQRPINNENLKSSSSNKAHYRSKEKKAYNQSEKGKIYCTCFQSSPQLMPFFHSWKKSL